MADLPKYQQTGRVFADLPQFDFSNVRESFQQSQRLAGSLDRLTGFANKFAAEAVQEQAETWSATNQITLEQLDAANAQGITLDDLIKSSGGGVVWQNTIRKMQGEQLRVQLENRGRVELFNIQKDIETGAVDVSDTKALELKLNSIGKGLFAPLQNVNPESYVKGLASFGVHSASLYNDAMKKSVANMKNAAFMNAEANLVNQIELDKVVIEGVNDWESLLSAGQTSVNKIYETFAASGDTGAAYNKAEKYRETFNNLVYNSFVKFTSTGDQAKDYSIITKMISGDFGDERKNAIFAKMPVDMQDNIIKTALERRSNNLSALKQQQELDKINNREQITNNKIKLFSGKLPKAQAIELASDMHAKQYISDELLKSIIKPPAEDANNKELLGQLKYKIAYGVYKSPSNIPDTEMSRLTDEQRGQVWAFSANIGAQQSLRETNAYISDTVKNQADSSKLDIIMGLESVKDQLRNEKTQANPGAVINEGALHEEAILKLQSSQKVANLISEQQSAYTAISRIPAVSKRLDKFDPSNVESFIKAYESELDRSDQKTLREQAAKFINIKGTFKNWKSFQSPTGAK